MSQQKQIMISKVNFGRLVFVAVFVLMSLIYGLSKTIDGKPQSIHIWRQTNSLSIALNYYEHNNSIFDPQIHNYFCDDGFSGKTAGEFPLIYFFVSKLWKVFGVHEWIFRLVQLIILFLGLFALFEISFYFLKNQFWAGFVSLLLYTSPMLVFYGVNFLPDGPSLSLMFMGWYFVLRYHQQRSISWLWVAAFLFTFAVVIKITSAISLIAFGGWIFYEWIFQDKEKRIVDYRWQQVLPFLTMVGLSGAWYCYVSYYNAIHKGEISYFGIWPVWKMTGKQFLEIKDAVDKIFFKEYMNPYLQYLTIVLWAILFARFRRNSSLQNWGLILLPLGLLCILILWFQVLNAHDYYLITMLFVFAFVWLSVFNVAKEYGWMRHSGMYVLLAAILAYNVFTCREQLSERYKGWMNDWYKNKLEALSELEPKLKELHIGKNDLVISIPDPSVVATLYLMDRPGYTDFGSDFTNEDEFKRRISQGAKYLIVNDTTILDRPEVKAFSGYYMGKYRNVKIFDLKPYR